MHAARRLRLTSWYARERTQRASLSAAMLRSSFLVSAARVAWLGLGLGLGLGPGLGLGLGPGLGPALGLGVQG